MYNTLIFFVANASEVQEEGEAKGKTESFEV